MKLRSTLVVCLLAAFAGSAIAAPAAGPRAGHKARVGNAQQGQQRDANWWGRKPPQERNGALGAVTAIGNGSITIKTMAGQTATYTVNDQTKIRILGRPGTLADIKVGNRVAIRCDAGQTTAKAIVVPKPGVNGLIESVSGNVVTVKGKDNTVYTVTVPDAARIHVFAHPTCKASITDLRPGYQMEAAGDLNGNIMVAKIVTFRPTVLRGTVSARNGETVTILTIDQKNVSCVTDARTVVTVCSRTAPNQPGSLSDVKNGDPVNIGGHLNGDTLQTMFIDVLVGAKN